jgi:two-component system, cell cycle response regulator
VGDTASADVVVAGGPIDTESTVDLLACSRRAADEVDGWLSYSEHGRGVGRWAALVAASFGEDESGVRRVELAGRLHDIGKVLIPQAIWRKPSAPSKFERQLVQQHSDYGYQRSASYPACSVSPRSSASTTSGSTAGLPVRSERC